MLQIFHTRLGGERERERERATLVKLSHLGANLHNALLNRYFKHGTFIWYRQLVMSKNITSMVNRAHPVEPIFLTLTLLVGGPAGNAE